MTLTRLGRLDDGAKPLELAQIAAPIPAPGQVRVKVAVCGVCHTELDEIEGRTPPSSLPRVLGHQVVGRIDQTGPGMSAAWIGRRVGVAWIFHACGRCKYCTSGRENLCAEFRATGRDVDGGYAEFMTVAADFVHPIPDGIDDLSAAPLLCAGAIGHRSIQRTELVDGQTLGLTGFGSSAHLVMYETRHRFPHSQVFVFARDEAERAFARELGASWTGAIDEPAPVKLDAIIDTTPAWTPVVESLAHLAQGGRLVINAIRKEDTDRRALDRLDFAAHLWLEKEVVSVANVTRQDVRDFLQLAAEIPIRPRVETFALEDANAALAALRWRGSRGSTVLRVATS